MKVWFTSDTHFGHTNIIKYTDRPFKSVEEMDEELIKRWNTKVDKEDTVFFIGDFSLTNKVEKYMNRLNGHIIWIKGNHDKKSIIHDLIIEYGGRHWHLAHNPEDCDGEYNLCGHVHEKWKVKDEEGKIFINVGVDQWDFYPISINTIIKLVKKWHDSEGVIRAL